MAESQMRDTVKWKRDAEGRSFVIWEFVISHSFSACDFNWLATSSTFSTVIFL